MTQLARHRLHDNFLCVKHAVDNDTESLATDLGNDDKATTDVTSVFVETEQVAQANEWQELVAQPQHTGVLYAFNSVFAAATRAYQLYDR